MNSRARQAEASCPMAICYEIDVPLRHLDGSDHPVSALRDTVMELWDRFGIVETQSVYRPPYGEPDPDHHTEWVRLSFDAPDSPQTHEAVAEWWMTELHARSADLRPLAVWYRPRR